MWKSVKSIFWKTKNKIKNSKKLVSLLQIFSSIKKNIYILHCLVHFYSQWQAFIKAILFSATKLLKQCVYFLIESNIKVLCPFLD